MAKKTTGAATRSTKTRSTAGPNTRPPSPRNEPPAVTAYRALLSAPEDGPLLAGEEFRERIEAATGRGAVDVLADVFARYLAPPPVPEWTEEAAPEVPGIKFNRLAFDNPAVVSDVLALLQTAEATACLRREDIPSSRPARHRLGFMPGDARPANPDLVEAWRKRKAEAARNGGAARHKCELTRTAFWLPFGSPVPSLIFDEARADGSTSRMSATVHPALLAAGPRAIARAAWQRAQSQAEDIIIALVEFLYMVERAKELDDPDAIGTEPPASAYQLANGGLTGFYV